MNPSGESRATEIGHKPVSAASQSGLGRIPVGLRTDAVGRVWRRLPPAGGRHPSGLQ
jgi:hypothetical protein